MVLPIVAVAIVVMMMVVMFVDIALNHHTVD
jgi:uncharacterized membrane protein YhdT